MKLLLLLVFGSPSAYARIGGAHNPDNSKSQQPKIPTPITKLNYFNPVNFYLYIYFYYTKEFIHI